MKKTLTAIFTLLFVTLFAMAGVVWLAATFRLLERAWRFGWALFALALIMATGSLPATPVLFHTASLTGSVNNREILITPDNYQNPLVLGTNLIATRAFTVQPVVGQVITNLSPWGYTIKVDGWPRSVHIVVPDSTNTINVVSLINTNAYSPVTIYSGGITVIDGTGFTNDTTGTLGAGEILNGAIGKDISPGQISDADLVTNNRPQVILTNIASKSISPSGSRLDVDLGAGTLSGNQVTAASGSFNNLNGPATYLTGKLPLGTLPYGAFTNASFSGNGISGVLFFSGLDNSFSLAITNAAPVTAGNSNMMALTLTNGTINGNGISGTFSNGENSTTLRLTNNAPVTPALSNLLELAVTNPATFTSNGSQSSNSVILDGMFSGMGRKRWATPWRGWSAGTGQTNAMEIIAYLRTNSSRAHSKGYNVMFTDFEWPAGGSTNSRPYLDANGAVTWNTNNYPMNTTVDTSWTTYVHSNGFSLVAWMGAGEQKLSITNVAANMAKYQTWFDGLRMDVYDDFFIRIASVLATNGVPMWMEYNVDGSHPYSGAMFKTEQPSHALAFNFATMVSLHHVNGDLLTFEGGGGLIEYGDMVEDGGWWQYPKPYSFINMNYSLGLESNPANASGVVMAAMISSPILGGCPVPLADSLTNYFFNPDILAIQGDTGVHCARLILKTNACRIWLKTLDDDGGGYALAFINTNNATPGVGSTNVTFQLERAKLPQSAYYVYDCIRHRFVSNTPISSLSFTLTNTTPALFRLYPRQVYGSIIALSGDSVISIVFSNGVLSTAPVPFDSDTVNYFNNAALTNANNNQIRVAANYIVARAKMGGWWSKADAMGLASLDTNASSAALKGVCRVSWNGGVGFGINGVTGDGSTGYGWLAGFNLATPTNNFSSNNASLFVYMSSPTNQVDTSGVRMWIGGIGGGVQNNIYRNSGDIIYDVDGINKAVNQTNNIGAFAGSVSGQLLTTYTRGDSGETRVSTFAGTAVAPGASGIAFLAWTNSGSGLNYYSGATMRGWFVGSALTPTDYEDMSDTFATADAYLKAYRPYSESIPAGSFRSVNSPANGYTLRYTNNSVYWTP